jgi:transcriptional regulator with XRE-family HTH domain
MARPTLATLGAMVRERRGTRKLRETAKEIGIGPATLMRIESGRVPDLQTFGKICRWLNVDPRPFLGIESKFEVQGAPALYQVSAHLRADQHPKPETVNALAKMILLAAQRRRGSQELPDDGDA